MMFDKNTSTVFQVSRKCLWIWHFSLPIHLHSGSVYISMIMCYVGNKKEKNEKSWEAMMLKLVHYMRNYCALLLSVKILLIVTHWSPSQVSYGSYFLSSKCALLSTSETAVLYAISCYDRLCDNKRSVGVTSVIYCLPQRLQCCMQYHVMIDCVITGGWGLQVWSIVYLRDCSGVCNIML